MKAIVVYESMYGNTHLIADAIATGLRTAADDVVDVVPVDRADPDALAGADLLVVGGPTHAHGMTWPSTRRAALEAANKPGSDLEVDPDAEGPGLRDWFDRLDHLSGRAAAFDTRIDAPPAFTGRASKGIAKRLRRHGCTLVAEPTSFLVTKENHLVPDEAAHARDWGSRLHDALAATG
ncbi:MAG TPA: flavodoxin domain-containing protein [Acidimicrobiia bacterium]|nr:flavodoxin domain-containing protein [Acidimicrobiia bacterium]